MAKESTPHDNALPKPVKARGTAKKHSKEELDALTSPDALRGAMKGKDSDWKEHAPPDFKNILDAEEQS